jgi:archaellum component FlaC
MPKFTRIGVLGLAASFVMVCTGSAVLTSSVMAVEGRDSIVSSPKPPISSTADRKDDLQNKLTDIKLKACQAREHGITNAMSRIATRGQRHLTLISNVATKAEDFYTKQGHNLSNYETLVADVNTKKTAAKTAIDNVKNSSGDFKCTGDNPKGATTEFAAKVKAMNTALKDYRTSVKTLIKGIKSVQPKNDSTEGSDQ